MDLADSAPTLPLTPLDARLPLGRPFTPLMAREVGVARSAIDRMHRDGVLRRLLRGVYVDATVQDTQLLRARGLTLAVPSGAIVVDRTAAWLHGVDVLRARPGLLPPLEFLGRNQPRGRHFAGHRTLIPEDLEDIGGVRVTTPLRTALDLGRLLAPDRALAALDALLLEGRFSHRDLLVQMGRFRHQRGVTQLRQLVPLADARARDAAESVLRLRWLDANLPTPIPGLQVGELRLVLGLEVQMFGAVLHGDLDAQDLSVLGDQGWRVVVLSRERVIGSDPYFVMGHLEREFHQQLLRQVG